MRGNVHLCPPGTKTSTEIKRERVESQIYHLHLLSAMDVEVGFRAGDLGLSTACEGTQRWPIVKGSAVKGALRRDLRHELEADDEDWLSMFGSSSSKTSCTGAIAVGDANLLCIPVRTSCGGIVWASCPTIMNRYRSDWQEVSPDGLGIPLCVPVPSDNSAVFPRNSSLAQGTVACLEDLEVIAEPDAKLQSQASVWAEWIADRVFPTASHLGGRFKTRFTVLPDKLLHVLVGSVTKRHARIGVRPDGRCLQEGMLRYEEIFPADSLLWGIVAVDRSRLDTLVGLSIDPLSKLPVERYLHIGGRAAAGYGRAFWRLGFRPLG